MKTYGLARALAHALMVNARDYFEGSIDTSTFAARYTAAWTAAHALDLTADVDAALQAAPEDAQLQYEKTADGEALSLILDSARTAGDL